MAIPEKLQQTSDQLGTESSVIQIPQLSIAKIKVKQRNFVVIQTNASGSNSYILDHETNGKMGSGFNGMGGSALGLDVQGSTFATEIIRRRYDWNSRKEFEQGSKSDNVDISQDILQLGNITVKNIYLNHKSR